MLNRHSRSVASPTRTLPRFAPLSPTKLSIFFRLSPLIFIGQKNPLQPAVAHSFQQFAHSPGTRQLHPENRTGRNRVTRVTHPKCPVCCRAICRLGFGLAGGYVIACSTSIRTMQTWTLAERAFVDAPWISLEAQSAARAAKPGGKRSVDTLPVLRVFLRRAQPPRLALLPKLFPANLIVSGRLRAKLGFQSVQAICKAVGKPCRFATLKALEGVSLYTFFYWFSFNAS